MNINEGSQKLVLIVSQKTFIFCWLVTVLLVSSDAGGRWDEQSNKARLLVNDTICNINLKQSSQDSLKIHTFTQLNSDGAQLEYPSIPVVPAIQFLLLSCRCLRRLAGDSSLLFPGIFPLDYQFTTGVSFVA